MDALWPVRIQFLFVRASMVAGVHYSTLCEVIYGKGKHMETSVQQKFRYLPFGVPLLGIKKFECVVRIKVEYQLTKSVQCLSSQE